MYYIHNKRKAETKTPLHQNTEKYSSAKHITSAGSKAARSLPCKGLRLEPISMRIADAQAKGCGRSG
ncbi:hypothetical protein BDV27DRAFT_122231 [Aspergillus caelatus]|uniref:Uncharacterized protein n=1 Tax=Aspergillus caelatus TaxID=61420 RepID=A0A5N7AHS1_9EURO|nr:uncharacterized protein BDV27DRAFT_122231 [Aspergillus caelatus]KAE8368559.1 hypothetical protein BDV27DRAFT_122231 [Aspergillus caelatus]